jgi:hypothetical protein
MLYGLQIGDLGGELFGRLRSGPDDQASDGLGRSVSHSRNPLSENDRLVQPAPHSIHTAAEPMKSVRF